MRILLVEDEPRMAQVVAKGLREQSYAVDIAAHVWDESFDALSNTIEVYVNRLRKKIDEQHPVKLIHTRRGEGYMLGPRSMSDKL